MLELGLARLDSTRQEEEEEEEKDQEDRKEKSPAEENSKDAAHDAAQEVDAAPLPEVWWETEAATPILSAKKVRAAGAAEDMVDKEEEAGLDLSDSFDVDGMEEEEEEEEEESEEDEPAVEELLEARSARAARRRASHLAESGDEGQQQEEEDEKEEEEGGVAAPISPPPLVAAGSSGQNVRRTSVGSGVPPPFDSPQTPLWLRAAQTQLANTPLPTHAEFIGCEDTETEIASERPISPPAATEIAKLTEAPSPEQGLATRDGRSRGRKGLAVAGVTALVLLLLLLLATLSSGGGGGPAATPAAPLDMQPAEEPTTASDVVTTGSRPPAVAISPTATSVKKEEGSAGTPRVALLDAPSPKPPLSSVVFSTAQTFTTILISARPSTPELVPCSWTDLPAGCTRKPAGLLMPPVPPQTSKVKPMPQSFAVPADVTAKEGAARR